MTVKEHVVGNVCVGSWLGCGILVWGFLGSSLANAQESYEEPEPEPYIAPIEQPPDVNWFERDLNTCNDTLGYVGCAQQRHGTVGRGAAPSPAPEPDVWGALAISPSSLRTGQSWNAKSEADAQNLALQYCRKLGDGDCKILKTVADVCVAFAVSFPEKVYGLGGPVGAGNYADGAARLHCQRAGGKSCKVETSFCADGQRHVLLGHGLDANGIPVDVTAPPSRPGATRVAQPVASPASSPSATSAAGDDTVRFYGTWTTKISANGQIVTVLSVHDVRGYRDFMVTPMGNVQIASGTFSAANGRYWSSAATPNNSGTYRFLNAETAVCTNAAGQSSTWTRQAKPIEADAAARTLAGYSPSAPLPASALRK